MLHKKRTWALFVVPDAETLAQKLTEQTWTLCSGFRLGEYLFLNDSFSEDGAQEYAVLKELPEGAFRQVESITFGWCDGPRGLELVRQVLAGEFDTSQFARSVHPSIEAPAEHGRCHLCS